MTKIDDFENLDGIDIVLLLKIRAARERELIRNNHSLSLFETLHRIALVNKKYTNLILVQVAKQQDAINQMNNMVQGLTAMANNIGLKAHQLRHSVVSLYQGNN
jgi:hypothetical protein